MSLVGISSSKAGEAVRLGARMRMSSDRNASSRILMRASMMSPGRRASRRPKLAQPV